MAKWAVDWQNKNPATVRDLSDPKAKDRRLIGDENKFAWLNSLTPNDEIWTELGASADTVCALALEKGVKKVRRVQTHILKDWRKANGLDASDSFKSLKRFAEAEPDRFYETPPAVADVLGLRCLVGHFGIIQEMRKAVAHRLRGVATMEFFLLGQDEGQEQGQEAESDNHDLAKELEAILGHARDGVLHLISERSLPQTLRRKFAAQFSAKRLAAGIMDEVTGRKRKRSDTDLEIYLRRRFAVSHIFWGIEQEEKHYSAEVEAHLETMPLYHEVYKKIPGMGPKIASRIMAAIGDIRRFRSAFALAAYFGYHVRPDGSCPRRLKGMSDELRKKIDSEGGRYNDYGAWNKLGRQGLFLWAEQVSRATPNKAPRLMPFKEKLVARKGYVARKYWLKAVAELTGAKLSPELSEFRQVMEATGPDWLRQGGALPGGPDNPYLAAANEPQVLLQPWMFRDALSELLRRSGEDESAPESEPQGPPSGEDEEALLAQEEAADKATKAKFSLPRLELRPELKREIKRFLRSYFLSRKRIHLGSYRWLINSVLIRNYIWPMNREFLGLSKCPDPEWRTKKERRLRAGQQEFEPVRFTDIAERERRKKTSSDT